MDSVLVGKMGGALLLIAPATFLFYCFLHENPKTTLLSIIKWSVVIISFVSIILGFSILTN